MLRSAAGNDFVNLILFAFYCLNVLYRYVCILASFVIHIHINTSVYWLPVLTKNLYILLVLSNYIKRKETDNKLAKYKFTDSDSDWDEGELEPSLTNEQFVTQLAELAITRFNAHNVCVASFFRCCYYY